MSPTLQPSGATPEPKSFRDVAPEPKRLRGAASFFEIGKPAPIGGAHRPVIEFLLRELRGVRILDLGGGEGAYALELQRRGCDVTVADIEPGSLRIAEQNGLQTLLLNPDAEEIEGEFDTVLLLDVLEHLDDPLPLLRRACRAARCRVLITSPRSEEFAELFRGGLTYAHIAVLDHLRHFTDAEWQQLLDEASGGAATLTYAGDHLYPHGMIALAAQAGSGFRARATLFMDFPRFARQLVVFG